MERRVRWVSRTVWGGGKSGDSIKAITYRYYYQHGVRFGHGKAIFIEIYEHHRHQIKLKPSSSNHWMDWNQHHARSTNWFWTQLLVYLDGFDTKVRANNKAVFNADYRSLDDMDHRTSLWPFMVPSSNTDGGLRVWYRRRIDKQIVTENLRNCSYKSTLSHVSWFRRTMNKSKLKFDQEKVEVLSARGGTYHMVDQSSINDWLTPAPQADATEILLAERWQRKQTNRQRPHSQSLANTDEVDLPPISKMTAWVMRPTSGSIFTTQMMKCTRELFVHG